MAKAISRFFADLEYPLRNLRWSWGARSGNSLLLRTWEDEYAHSERRLAVLDRPELHRPSESFGLDERIVQLKALWEGGVAGYTIIAKVKNRAANPIEIKDYRPDAVFAINSLEAQPDGSIIARVGDKVPVSDLSNHRKTHRTAPGRGAFPVDDSQRSGLSTDSYKQKIPGIRAWLIETSLARKTVTYSDLMTRFALSFYPLVNALGRLGHECQDAGEPIITALVVDKDTHRCSPGIFDEFHDDDELERGRCYAHWAPTGIAASPSPASPALANNSAKSNNDFEQRAARSAQAQTRPEQGLFRDAVFRACCGRCVISGCAVPEALEAAHLLGKDWRQGHNSAADGILLRRDLHNLYDRGLLRVSDTGEVTLLGGTCKYYGEFHKKSVIVHCGRGNS